MVLFLITCTFTGHREVYASGISDKLHKAIEIVLAADTAFTFYVGGMGDFDAMCAAAVRVAKGKHPDLDIQLVLVAPYMSNDFNTNKEYYESSYDDITIPIELADVHYKAAIQKRNRWMVDQADYLISFVYRDFGGAFATLKYAKRKKGLTIIELSER